MKKKAVYIIILLVILLSLTVIPALAWTTTSNTLTRSYDYMKGTGTTTAYSSNGEPAIIAVMVACTMYSSVDGYNYPIYMSYAVERTGPGAVTAITKTLISYHHGERLKNYCTHGVWYSGNGYYTYKPSTTSYINVP